MLVYIAELKFTNRNLHICVQQYVICHLEVNEFAQTFVLLVKKNANGVRKINLIQV